LESHDLDATAEALRQAGIKLTVEPKMGLDHNRQCWIEDPDGNRIEFMQMSLQSMQAEAIRRLKNG
jgi:lactoylglutathione lyase